jgi:molybdopterin converting factor small subunit
MQIHIATGPLRATLDYPTGAGLTVRDALLRCAADRPDIRHGWVDASGGLRESIQVFVNGESVRYRDGLATRLSDGDEVYIIPLIAGG